MHDEEVKRRDERVVPQMILRRKKHVLVDEDGFEHEQEEFT